MKRSQTDSPDLQSLLARLGGAEALTAAARKHKPFLRSRKIKSATDLLRLLIIYAIGGLSLRSTAAVAADADLADLADLADVALMQRFRRAANWLEALCGERLAQADQAILQPLGGAMPDQRIIIGDRSLITAPGGSASACT